MSELSESRRAEQAAGDTVTWQDARNAGAVVVAGAWVGYFLFTGMPQLTLEVFPATLTLHIVVAVAALAYLVGLAITRRLPGGTPLDLPVLGFLAAYALATATSSYWRVGIESTLQIGIALIACYALSDLPWLSAHQLRRALQLVAAAIALYALWVVGNDYANYLSFTSGVEGVSADNVFPPTVPRVHDVSDHPNVLAMVLALFMPFFALSAMRGPSRWERAGGIGGLLVSGMAIFLTLSRGGWIGAASAVVLAAAGVWATARLDGRDGGSWRALVPANLNPTAIAAMLGAVILVVGGTLAFLSNSSTRPGWLFRSSLSPREDAWHAGLDIFGDNVLKGAGPNTFGLLYPAYSGKFLIHTQHAHNGFLQVADDAGLVGLAALAALAGAIAYMLFRTWREGSLDQRLLAVACGAGLVGFSLHNQLDAGNIWKAPGIALALVGAIIVRNYRERATPGATAIALPAWSRHAGMATRVLLLALVFVPFVAWYRIDGAHRDYWRGLEALNEGRGAEGLSLLQDAVDADSSLMVYQMQLGQQQASIYKTAREKDPQLIAAAIAHLERAVALDERSPLAHANLARAYQLAGRTDDATTQAQLARLTRQHVPPVLMVAELYEDMGMEQRAIETYGQALSMDAGIADASFWQTSDFRRTHFDEILAKSTLGINPCTKGGYLVQAHRTQPTASLQDLDAAVDGCKLLLLEFPNDLVLRVALAKMLIERGDSDEARSHLDYAVNRQPDFGPAHTELGRLRQAEGDLDAARREWVIGGQLEEPESLLLLGNSYPTGQVPADVTERMSTLLAGFGSSIKNDTISILYYRLRYGRISPQSALIPGAWQQAVPRLYSEMVNAARRWTIEAGRRSS